MSPSRESAAQPDDVWVVLVQGEMIGPITPRSAALFSLHQPGRTARLALMPPASLPPLDPRRGPVPARKPRRRRRK